MANRVTHPEVLWDNVSISGGETSPPSNVMGYRKFTIYFLTDTDGDITIEGDPSGEGGIVDPNDDTRHWLEIDSASAIGVRDYRDPWETLYEDDLAFVRVSFSAAANVTLVVVRYA